MCDPGECFFAFPQRFFGIITTARCTEVPAIRLEVWKHAAREQSPHPTFHSFTEILVANPPLFFFVTTSDVSSTQYTTQSNAGPQQTAAELIYDYTTQM